MAGYQRFVAYIYEYYQGKKAKNTGFAKVDSRNGVCKMQIHLQEIPQEETVLDIYGFVREQEWLLGVFLGKAVVQNTVADIRVTTQTDHIGDSKYGLEQISGLWLSGGQGSVYLTAWDEEPVLVDRLVTELPGRQNIAEADTIVQEDPEAEVLAAEIDTQQNERDMMSPCQEELAEEAEEELEEAQELRTEEAELPVNMPSRMEEEGLEEGQELEADELDQKSLPEEDSVFLEESVEEQTDVTGTEEEFQRQESMNAQGAEDCPVTSGCGQDAIRDSETSCGNSRTDWDGDTCRQNRSRHQSNGNHQKRGCTQRNQCAQHNSIDHRWKCLADQYPHMQPFEDDEITDCIRIAPKDLVMLRQNQWRMGKNSFMMHGYYNYQHLLLGKRKQGGYILAVPGLSENQEQFMASMFGFPNFKLAKEQNNTGRFGYWYRPVE